MSPIVGRVGRGAAVAAVVVGLSGCFWPSPGTSSTRQSFNPFESRLTVETVGGVEQLWEAAVDEGPVGDPVTSSAGVHVNDARSVYAFSARTGARRWQYTAPTSGVMYQPYVWRGGVLVSQAGPAAADRKVLELDRGTGTVTREVAAGGLLAVRQDVAVTSSWTLFCPRPGVCVPLDRMVVQNLATGEQLMNEVFNGAGVEPAAHDVTLAEDWVVHSGTGLLLDDPFLPDVGLRGYSISTPAPDCGVGIITRCPNWSVGYVDGPIVLSDDEATLYVGAAVYDVATGTERWRIDNLSAGTPALAGGSLYMASTSTSGVLRAFDAAGCGEATCEPLWSAPVPGGVAAGHQPAVAGGVVYVAGASGVLYAFDAAGCGAATCQPLWSASVGSGITGAPAVSNGQVYVGTADGRLVAFGLPPA